MDRRAPVARTLSRILPYVQRDTKSSPPSLTTSGNMAAIELPARAIFDRSSTLLLPQ